MLLISSGNPILYNSKTVSCPDCEFIGKNVTLRQEDYATGRPGSDEENEEKDEEDEQV